MKRLALWFDWLVKIMAIIAGLMLLFSTFSVTAEVIVRSGFGGSLRWVEEATSYSLLYICFLSAPWVLQLDGHVNVDIAISYLSARGKLIAALGTFCVAAIVCLILTWYGTQITIQLYQTNYFNPTVLAPPKYLFIFVIPLGFVCMFIEFLRKINRCLQALRTPAADLEKVAIEVGASAEKYGM